tara:strand:- start:94 stop:462 length:369 start_codon:yes stop_codon:yes gene_type:complete
MDNIDLTPAKEDFLLPENNSKNDIKTFFCSDRGHYIVNAVTGDKYDFKVGSIDEKRFWRVIVPFTKDGVTNSVKLFYENPKEYQFHRDVYIEPNDKINWNKRNTNHKNTTKTTNKPVFTSVK